MSQERSTASEAKQACNVYTSASVVPSRSDRWAAGIVSGVLIAALFITLPHGRIPLPRVAAFLPVYLTLAIGADVLTTFLLLAEYRATGSRPLALLAVAYTFSATIAVAQACAFPGLFSPSGLFGAQSQTAVWLWAIWHGGFPALAALYGIGRLWARSRLGLPTLGHAAIAVVAGVAAGLVCAVVAYTAPLPILVAGDSYVGGFGGSWQTLVVIASVSLGLTIVLTRLATVLDLWLTVVLLGTLCDVLLTIFAQDRYSLGWYLARVCAVFTSATVALVFLGEFARLSYRFAQLAAVDPLTGLANRRSFDERLEEGLRAFVRTGEPLTLLMIDVDDFKRFNDTYGHVAGDAALRGIADAIREVVNRPRDVVARYGGEEFVIVLSDTPLEGALSVAERIRVEVVRRRIPHKGNRAAPYVTVSLGAASARGGSPDARELIERADIALYRAKGAGRNRIEADASPLDLTARAESGSVM